MSEGWFPGVDLFNKVTGFLFGWMKEKEIMNTCECKHEQSKHEGGDGVCLAEDPIKGYCTCVKFVCEN